jgi:hypothetical protein
MSRWGGISPNPALDAAAPAQLRACGYTRLRGLATHAWSNTAPGDLCRLAWQANRDTVCFGGLASLVTALV